MLLSFHGAAREVSGACFLLESAETKVLIDCGLFQGCEACADLNLAPFQFDPKKIDAVIITHGHLDHIGRVPRLIREGFRGAIYSTPATKDLAEVMLKDALNVARHEGEELYGERDLHETFSRWKEVPYYSSLSLGDIKFTLHNAGHILGSSMVEVLVEGKRLLFAEDLGNIPSTLLPDPDTFSNVEYLVIESTYGSRTHEPIGERALKLERAVEDTAQRKGVLMVPAFATERTQEILHHLNEMILFKRIPSIPVFVDAPLAIRVTEVFEKHIGLYNKEIHELLKKHPNLFRFKTLTLTPSVEESKAINDVPPPKVIIAGSGMLAGGRILHHAKRYLSDPKNILLITGYQAPGALGRRLVDGEKMVKILGEQILVEVEIRKMFGFSAHADNPQLFAFVESNRDSLKRVFIVHGEEAQGRHLAQEIKDRLGVHADVPALHERFEI